MHYERLFVFTLMWSIGAFLELDDRSKIEDWLRHNDETEKTVDLPVIPSDSDATMFDYLVDPNGGCRASGGHREGMLGATSGKVGVSI